MRDKFEIQNKLWFILYYYTTLNLYCTMIGFGVCSSVCMGIPREPCVNPTHSASLVFDSNKRKNKYFMYYFAIKVHSI